MLVLAAERAWDEGNEGLVKKGGETAADRGHGRRGEVAINKYTERTGGVRGRERERERGGESGRSSHEEAREREKYRGMRIVGERKRRRAKRSSRLSDRPSVRSCVPKAPTNLTDARSKREREKEREREKGRRRKKAGQGDTIWKLMERDGRAGHERERKGEEGSGERLCLKRQEQTERGREKTRDRQHTGMREKVRETRIYRSDRGGEATK